MVSKSIWTSENTLRSSISNESLSMYPWAIAIASVFLCRIDNDSIKLNMEVTWWWAGTLFIVKAREEKSIAS